MKTTSTKITIPARINILGKWVEIFLRDFRDCFPAKGLFLFEPGDADDHVFNR
jgi:hypothetical protein